MVNYGLLCNSYQQTENIFLQNINQLLFKVETQCLLFEGETESLYKVE